ncbi:PGF-CTERM sorting domain-containing protein, partial [Candidatus Bathyarchaeota archaeon]|nr:PGF-CTERM sorting domain-containing protein [Candidatus Bathyarchaeota archaeon]
DTYGVFKNANVNQKTLSVANTDTTVSLSRDSTINLMGSMNFKVADSDTLRFYPMVEYQIGKEVTPTTPTPTGTAPAKPTTTNVTTAPPTQAPAAQVTTPAVATTTATPKKEPGFEAFVAIAGLLAVAFLVLRQRK